MSVTLLNKMIIRRDSLWKQAVMTHFLDNFIFFESNDADDQLKILLCNLNMSNLMLNNNNNNKHTYT